MARCDPISSNNFSFRSLFYWHFAGLFTVWIFLFFNINIDFFGDFSVFNGVFLFWPVINLTLGHVSSHTKNVLIGLAFLTFLKYKPTDKHSPDR